MAKENQKQDKPREHPLIAKAIALFGTHKRLAKAADINQSQITRMLNRERPVTAISAVKIDKATGGEVSKYALRPDIFGKPPKDEK